MLLNKLEISERTIQLSFNKSTNLFRVKSLMGFYNKKTQHNVSYLHKLKSIKTKKTVFTY